MNKNRKITIVILLFVFTIAALLFLITRPKKPFFWTPAIALKPAAPPDMTDQADIASLVNSINQSLEYFDRTGSAGVSYFGPEQIPNNKIKQTLEDFKHKLNKYGLKKSFFDDIKKNYRFYRSAAKKTLFTGYFEASLKGSRTQTDSYRYPLYRKPEDLYRIDLSKFYFYKKLKGLPKMLKARLTEGNTLIPYFSRREIDSHKNLADKNLELVWVNNEIDVFFLQIQGSGIVHLEDGQQIRVNYDDSNGHPYRAIGRFLVDSGLMELKDVSMQSIRQYLIDNPDKREQIFNYNPSYVFFRQVEQGPIGSLGVPLTPYRSIALDKELFPRGALCYYETEIPRFDNNGMLTGWIKKSGFILNQDSGGAIRTPGRADLFTGYGRESELVAGHLRKNGSFYFLLKK